MITSLLIIKQLLIIETVTHTGSVIAGFLCTQGNKEWSGEIQRHGQYSNNPCGTDIST